MFIEDIVGLLSVFTLIICLIVGMVGLWFVCIWAGMFFTTLSIIASVVFAMLISNAR